MGNIINFISDHYAWFLTITIILLFALIGYIYDTKRNKDDLLKKSEQEMDEEVLQNIVVPEGKSLAETVNVSKNINTETGNVELNDPNLINDNEDNSN